MGKKMLIGWGACGKDLLLFNDLFVFEMMSFYSLFLFGQLLFFD
jgi:hypothetical protein